MRSVAALTCFAAMILCVFVGTACNATVKKVQVTEVLVRVHASSEVRDAARKLRLRISVQQTENAKWSDRPPVTIDVPDADDSAQSTFWPVDVPVTPRDPAALPQLFEIIAEALDADDSVLVQQRALTSFVKESQRMIELTLQRCGGQELGALCEQEADCHGLDCRRCNDDACGSTEITKPDTLAPISDPSHDADEDGESGSGGESGRQAGSGGSSGRPAAGSGGVSGRTSGAGGKPAAGSGGSGKSGSGGTGGAGGSPPEPAETWSAPDFLETDAAPVTGASAARNAAGDLSIAWRQDSGAGSYWVRRYVNGTWDSVPFNLYGTQPPVGRYDMSMGVESSGAVQLFFSDGTPQTRWLRWNGETTLPAPTPPYALGGQTYGYPALIEVSEAGNAIALWGGTPPDSITQSQSVYLNRYSAGTWGTPTSIGTTGGELSGYALGANSAGDFVSLFKVGTAPGTLKCFASHAGAVTSPTAFTLSDAVILPTFLIGVDDSGNALALFVSGADAQHLRFMWSRYNTSDGTWSGAAPVSSQPIVNGAVTVANSQLIIATLETSPDDATKLHLSTYRYSDGSWSAAERISDDFKSEAQDLLFTANSAGGLIVAWSQTATLTDNSQGKALSYRRYKPQQGWGTTGTISTFAGIVSLAGLTLADDGKAVAVWMHADSVASVAHLVWSRSQ